MVENGENPMQGIAMMREILAEDSTNIDVHWQLAQFSLTSRQIENAPFDFRRSLSLIKTTNILRHISGLLKSKLELNNKEEAISLLEKYLTLETDSVVINGVAQMLMKLKQE